MKRLRQRSAGFAAFAALAGCATAGPGERAQETAAAAPVAAAKPAFVRADIVGRGSAELDRLLGPAALIRREGQGEFRRYGLADCALIVILAPDEAGEQRAVHLDAAAKISGETPPDIECCLAAGLPPKPVS